jgi:hypothetical protein
MSLTSRDTPGAHDPAQDRPLHDHDTAAGLRH